LKSWLTLTKIISFLFLQVRKIIIYTIQMSMASTLPNSSIQSGLQPLGYQHFTSASSLVAQVQTLLQKYRNDPLDEARGYPHSLRESAMILRRRTPLEGDIETFRIPGLRGRTFYRVSQKLVSETYFIVDRLENVLTESSILVAELVEHRTRLPTVIDRDNFGVFLEYTTT
jgi:hypothetical protein